MEILNVIVKPLNYCNQNCIYCFDKKQHINAKLINQNDLLAFAEKVFNEFNKTNWIWHGGEPTLINLEWFEDTMYKLNLLREKSRNQVVYSIQTNGLQLNDDWWKILNRYNIIPSISYDIIKDDRINIINNKENIAKCPSTITVLTKNNIDKIWEIYEENKKGNKTFSLNFPFATDRMSLTDILGDEDKAIENYMSFLQRYIYDQDGIEERTATSWILTALGKPPSMCQHIFCREADIISIDSQGQIWKCDNHNFDELKLCHINDYVNFNVLNEQIKKLNIYQIECADCEFNLVCGKGCLHCRLKESQGKLPYSLHCKMVKRIVPFLHSKLYNLTPEEFVQLNPAVRAALMSNFYLPWYIQEKLWTRYLSISKTDTEQR